LAVPKLRPLALAVALPVAALSLSAAAVGTAAASTTTTTAPSSTTTQTPPSAADVWLLKAIGAEQKVGSVRITGTIHQSGVLISLALHVNGDGEGGGTFVQSGARIQLSRVGPILYFNAPTKFWAAHATKQQTATYGGKWIEVSALDSRFESFDQFLDAADLVSAVFSGHTTPLQVSKPTKLNGRKVVIVSDTVVVKGKRTTGRMYIASTGKPVVYKIVDQGPAENGVINFSDYGKPVSISTPPEPINLTN